MVVTPSGSSWRRTKGAGKVIERRFGAVLGASRMAQAGVGPRRAGGNFVVTPQGHRASGTVLSK